MGYIPFDPHAANLRLMLVSRRYERASLSVTSNKPFSAWGEIFGEFVTGAPTAAPQPAPAVRDAPGSIDRRSVDQCIRGKRSPAFPGLHPHAAAQKTPAPGPPKYRWPGAGA